MLIALAFAATKFKLSLLFVCLFGFFVCLFSFFETEFLHIVLAVLELTL